MPQTRRTILAFALALPVLVAIERPAFAEQPAVFAPDGLAISGYDPVLYLTENRAQPGKPEFALEWHGASWRFASAETLTAFEMNPKAYAPQYGGYCAYAVSKGALATSDPEAFTVWNGRLYLNYSADVRTIWREDIAGNVEKADGHWPAVLRSE
ncbi:MAG: YHS domain protein [Rhodobacteraceae bacterium]|nr:YHS domain protein [Paracoccaceae bacterium]